MICKKTVSSWLSLALLCISLPFATAQQRFSAGPRVGVNLSSFAGNAEGNQYRPGLTAGLFVMYSSLNHFGVSVDALYSQMGANYSAFDALSQTSITYKQRLTYIEIPVALRYFLTTGGTFRPNLFVGPSLGFLVKGESLPTERLGVQFPTIDNTSSFRPLDLGLMAGFQLNFPGFGVRQRFLIDGRYRYGLNDVRKDNTTNSHNSVFTLTLGYGFGVGPEYRSRYKQ
jgi:hypothetical protein